MKKVIKFFIISLFFIFSICSVYSIEQIEKIAVFPVNIPQKGAGLNIYPDTLNLISNDIINSLNKTPNLSVLDLNSTENLIKSLGLDKDYQKLLQEYKDSYKLNYNSCALIANKIGVNKILFVSGGFDTQKLMLKRNLLYKLDIPGGAPLVPSYKLNIALTLIDPQSGIIIWENTYKKNLNMENFSIPSQYFGENIIPVEKIKNFSHKISAEVSKKLVNILKTSEHIESHITGNNFVNFIPKIETMDGLMTKEGHSYSTNNDFILNNRKNNYKNWIKKRLP
ncbi:MAG: hypothetical protein V2B14_02845 [bacterium]